MKITGQFKAMEKKVADNATYLTIGDLETFEKYTLVLPKGAEIPTQPVIDFKDTPVRMSWGKYNVVIRILNNSKEGIK